MSYAQFQSRVPLQKYEDLAPLIEHMKRGEADVLWPGTCAFYVMTSGAITGVPKCLPVTEAMLAHFQRAALDASFYYTARVGHAGVFRGRHLTIGGSTALAPIMESQPFLAYRGDLDGIINFSLPEWVDKHFSEPGDKITRFGDWDAKLAAIVTRCATRDISLVAGIPNWMLMLVGALRERARRQGHPIQNLRDLWPNLECFVNRGMSLGPFADELKQAFGPEVNFHEIYVASEGFIAAQDVSAAQGLRLLAGAGLFFEFLPMSSYDASRLADLGSKAVPLEGVKPGVNYALLVTTPAGLCRYVIGDIVRFISTEPPRLLCVGRIELRLNEFGENAVGKDINDTLAEVCARHGWQVVNFHVAPVVAKKFTGQIRGRHEWWLELKPGTIETPTGPVIAPELDAGLARINADYAARRASGVMEPPVVRLLMPGVFETWMRRRGRWGGQYKMPRSRSDREIADELAQIARFYE